MQRDGGAEGDLGRGGRRLQRNLRAGRQPAEAVQDTSGERTHAHSHPHTYKLHVPCAVQGTTDNFIITF